MKQYFRACWTTRISDIQNINAQKKSFRKGGQKDDPEISGIVGYLGMYESKLYNPASSQTTAKRTYLSQVKALKVFWSKVSQCRKHNTGVICQI